MTDINELVRHPITQLKPRPITAIEPEEYVNEEIQQVMIGIKETAGLQVSVESIQSVKKTESAVSTIYTVEVSGENGNETVSVGVDKETNKTHLVDYLISEKKVTVEVSESEVLTEVKTGVKVVKTSNKTAIRESEYVQKVMEEIKVVEVVGGGEVLSVVLK